MGRRLVVLVHGLGSSKLMDDVATLVAECLPDADIVTAKYNSSLFSNSPADDEAHALAWEIGCKEVGTIRTIAGSITPPENVVGQSVDSYSTARLTVALFHLQ
jgi:hypothetical protein